MYWCKNNTLKLHFSFETFPLFYVTLQTIYNPYTPEFTIVHPLQAANCCRNSRLVVDKDDLMWFKNYRKLLCIGEPVSWKFSF